MINVIKKIKLGFTLLELGIVLAVISLLSISVVKGMQFIDISKAQTIIREQYQIREAVNNFREKFNSLPGDLSNPTSIDSEFGGNGDGFISSSPITPSLSNPAYSKFPHVSVFDSGHVIMSGVYESVILWEHLQKAGLIKFKQNFSALTRYDAAQTFIMPDVPKTETHKDQRYAYILSHSQRLELLNNPLILKKFHTLELGNFREFYPDTLYPKHGAIKSKIAFYIDNKVDDGKPLTGEVISINGSLMQGKCSTTDDSNPVNNEDYYKLAQYNTSTKLESCIMSFIISELPYQDK